MQVSYWLAVCGQNVQTLVVSKVSVRKLTYCAVYYNLVVAKLLVKCEEALLNALVGIQYNTL